MESFFAADCTETVNLLHAVFLGADGACVSIGIGSLLGAFAAFIAAVVIAQIIARRVWARLTRPRPRRSSDDDAPHGAIRDDPDYADSPIKSSRRI